MSTTNDLIPAEPAVVGAPREPLIFERMCRVMEEIGPVAKADRNEFNGYNYRGIERIVNAAKPMFAKHRVLMTFTILREPVYLVETLAGKERSRCVIHVRAKFYTSDGSFIESDAVGEGLDKEGDKACNKAMSAAQKYIIMQTLMIATYQADSEKDEEGERGSSGRSADRATDSTPMLTAQMKAYGVEGPENIELVVRYLMLSKTATVGTANMTVVLKKLAERGKGGNLLQRAQEWFQK